MPTICTPAPPETCATEPERDPATDPRVGDRVLMPPECADYEVIKLLPEFGVIVRHFKGSTTISRDGYNRAVWRGICRTPGAKVERGPG